MVRAYVIDWQGLALTALAVQPLDQGPQVTALRTFVYLLMEPDQILASEQQSLQALDLALSRAPAIGAERVLVHAGFERVTDEDAKAMLGTVGNGTWLTPAASAVRPKGWKPDAQVLPSRSVSEAEPKTGRNRPGRKEDPSSARFKAREIYKAHWQDKSDREIKRMMAEQLDMDDRVANTYFIDFRREMGHVSKRQKAKSVEALS